MKSENVEKQNNKAFRLRYILAAVLIISTVIALSIFSSLNHESQSDPESEKIIREAAAKQLNKEPNDLTDEDFEKITELTIGRGNLKDISLLEKFTNLQELQLYFLSPPFAIPEDTPKWKVILSKLGIITIPKYKVPPWSLNSEENRIVDIKPLEKLAYLEKLTIYRTNLINVRSLGRLRTLKELSLQSNDIHDIYMLKNLKNLQSLQINGNSINDLEPLKALTNLQYLNINRCDNISKEQVEDLQNALLNTEIIYKQGFSSQQILITKPEE